MYKKLFAHVKKIIPKISQTEIIALKSGGTSIDRDIFLGQMNYRVLFAPVKKYYLSKRTEADLYSLLRTTGEGNIYPSKNIHTVKCLDYLLQDAEQKMNLVIFNYPIRSLRPILYPVKSRTRYTSLNDKNRLYRYIAQSEQSEPLNDLFNGDIYYTGTVLEKLVQLSKLDPSSNEYQVLYQDIIKVC